MKGLLFVLVMGSLCLSSCNATSTSAPAITTYTIGVTVSGLLGTGLVLQDNGGNNLPVNGNGSFTFTEAVDSGATYNVAVLTEPSGHTQNCVVANGNGKASANVTNVDVTCVIAFLIGGTVINLAGTNGGLQLQDNAGDTLQVNASGPFVFPTAIDSGGGYNVTVFAQPSAPKQTCEVTNGAGIATAIVSTIVVDCGHGQWTWMGGDNVNALKGVYGTKGVSAPGNAPGGRSQGVSWIDKSGNLWIFGGAGYDSTGAVNQLNDLWEYSAGQWTWIGGSDIVNQKSIYGTEGKPAPGNIPGARGDALGWTDGAGNFLLFGGAGFDSTGTLGVLNDLWKYGASQWTWVSGANVINQYGIYGTLGSGAPGDVPGARAGAATWTDVHGNLWLFGGTGNAISGNGGGYLSDLWEYSAGQWTWMGGPNIGNQRGEYGMQGVSAPGREIYIWFLGRCFRGLLVVWRRGHRFNRNVRISQ